MSLSSGKTYVMDRAYSDIKLWLKIKNAGADFVTRLKSTPRHLEIQKQILKDTDQTGVLYDAPWTPSESACRRAKIKPKTIFLRHIIYRSPEEDKELFHFITSNTIVPAQEIADIYKKRWSVELLFRWLKQHLKTRTISAQTNNGVRSEICLSLLTHLLLVLRKEQSHSSEPLIEIYRDIRLRLFDKSRIQQGFQGSRGL